MPIIVESTTDTPEAVKAAQGNLAPKVEEKVETAAEVLAKSTAETKEASEASLEKKVDAEGKEETAEQKAEREVKEQKAKKKGGFKKRIDKLNAKNSALEQERNAWREQALKASKPAPEKQSTETKEADPNARPKVESFETHEEYVEALADWKVEQKLSQRDQKAKERDLKSDFEKRVSTHSERVEAFKKQRTDFEDVIESIDDIPMSTTVQQAILDSEDGPELMYQLAKNRKEYEKICKLPALAAARELGKFEARIAKASESTAVKETKTTTAPAPISPVGKGSVTVTKDPGEMSMVEYNKWRNAGGGI